MDMPKAIDKVITGKNLSQEEMRDVMRMIMTGQATDAQIGGFLVGLRLKGETVDEIVAAASVMRELATRVDTKGLNIVDTCGTGGSGSNKFNVSTAAAFVTAAAGVKVAKHGNRGASSKSGSADLLEKAGANIMLSPEEVARCIVDIGVGFMFAASHHAAMKHAINARKEMVVRTIFNLLGPLTNPAGARRQVLGIFDRKWLRPLAEVLKQMGSEHVLVVHSRDGLDEISIADKTDVVELKDGVIREYTIGPEDFGMQVSSLRPLVVTNPEESLVLVRAALSGENQAAADMVILNAGAAIYAGGASRNLEQGIEMARDAVSSGMAAEKMKDFVEYTSQLAEAG
ncbi:MAG: anthranilate phosphoribosyltransferase [Gammaproteobacteria bacterium]|nr:anthranilate phosphoribosyltransferase [Gammaproteobacteria bacterium]